MLGWRVPQLSDSDGELREGCWWRPLHDPAFPLDDYLQHSCRIDSQLRRQAIIARATAGEVVRIDCWTSNDEPWWTTVAVKELTVDDPMEPVK